MESYACPLTSVHVGWPSFSAWARRAASLSLKALEESKLVFRFSAFCRQREIGEVVEESVGGILVEVQALAQPITGSIISFGVSSFDQKKEK